MPVLLYQCIHCEKTNEHEDKIVEHEKECKYNSETKHCQTCSKKYYGFYETTCTIGKEDFHERYFNGKLNCEGWE